MPKKSHHSNRSDPQINRLKEKLARALADYQNLEKRFRQESAEVVKFANLELLRNLIDFKDNLERAVTTLKDQGLALVLDQFNQILTRAQVREIKALNQTFDPKLMEAEEVVAGDKDKVVAVVRKGYLLHDRLLRPAKVKVGSGQQPTNQQSTTNN